jgi:ribosome maturation factor RimP
LDEADPIGGGYHLEVSSPGIDRPLTRLEDFAAREGLEARIELEAPHAGRRRFRGLLAGIDGEAVRIAAGEEGEVVSLPFHEIGEARLVINEALLERGAAERARRLEQAETLEERGQP